MVTPGDATYFGMATEMARAEGIDVETVLTNDDVAVEDSLYTVGRRGSGVTVLMQEICGGTSDDGRYLPAVAELGRRVNANGRTMRMALTPFISLTTGEPSFELPEIEIGIHGELGRFREKIGPASHRRAADDADPVGPAVLLGRSCAGVRQRHAAERTVRDVRRGA